MPDVTETGQAFDILGRRVAVGRDEDAVYLHTFSGRFLFEGAELDSLREAIDRAAPKPCSILFADGPRRVCREPAAGTYQGTCERGHVTERPLCAEHAEKAHLCATCFYHGDNSDVTLTLLAEAHPA